MVKDIGKHLIYLSSRSYMFMTYDVVPCEEEKYLCVDMTNKESVSRLI